MNETHKESTVIPDSNKKNRTLYFLSYIFYKYNSTCLLGFLIFLFILSLLYLLISLCYKSFQAFKDFINLTTKREEIPFLSENKVFRFFIEFMNKVIFRGIAIIAFCIIVVTLVIIIVLYIIRGILSTFPIDIFIGNALLKLCPFNEGEPIFKLIDNLLINVFKYKKAEDGKIILYPIVSFITEESYKHYLNYQKFSDNENNNSVEKNSEGQNNKLVEKFTINENKKNIDKTQKYKYSNNPIEKTYLLYYNNSYANYNLYENFSTIEGDNIEVESPKTAGELICEEGKIKTENLCKCVNMKISGNTIEDNLKSKIEKSNCFELDCCVKNEIKIDELKKKLEKCDKDLSACLNPPPPPPPP